MIGDLLVVSRAGLAGVFLVAGAAKLTDPAASRRALSDYGFSASVIGPAAILLPAAEIVTGALLLTGPLVGAGALAALALLLVFTTAMATAVARGREGDCQCFGRLAAAPAAFTALVRNVLLTVLAAFVVVAGARVEVPGVLSWAASLGTAGQRAAICIAALLGLVLISRVARLMRGSGSGAGVMPVDASGRSSGTRTVDLTIGIVTYDDYDGVYFTLQALRMYHDVAGIELLVVDNYGCDHTRQLVEGWVGGRYIRAVDVTGTAWPRDVVFREARGEAVLCCDSDVLLEPGVIARLRQYYRDHPDCRDLLQGPLLSDSGELAASLGMFSCRKAAWPGFNPAFHGYDGEEGYIHEEFRKRGARCVHVPWLRWMHRFGRPRGAPFAVVPSYSDLQ
ncbi:MAG TPA: MauE/DoxX family redox-associated membrane protein [Longimicrobiales bacterium]|nr:MauE/DoxX family redox-associated membrane protein [Longimicrobiales bacterium]